jgi:predicted dehydrogenase
VRAVDNLRIGFIGTGGFARQVLLPALAEMPDVHLAAVCDLRTEAVEQIVAKYRVDRKYTDHRRMLAEGDLDAVFVATPPGATAGIVSDCLRNDINTFLEKPPGINIQETARLAALARSRRVTTMVGFNRPFCPILRQAKDLVEDRGPVAHAVVNYHKPVGYEDDLVWDIIHEIAVMRYLCGEPKRLVSRIGDYFGGRENSYGVIVEFEGGAVGILNCFRVSGARHESLEIHGNNISAYLVLPDAATVVAGDRSTRIEASKIAPLHHTYGYTDEIRHFVQCVKDNRPAESNDLEDGLKTMRFLTAIRKSKNQGFADLAT